MKHLLLSLFVAFAVASCGSDGNKVSGNYSYTDPLSNPNLGSGNNWALQSGLLQAKSALENHTTVFGTGKIVTSDLYTTSCKDKWKIKWCTTNYNPNATYTAFNDLISQNVNLYYIYSDGSYAQHSGINVTDRLNYLSSIFARATQVSVGSIGSAKVFGVYVGQEYYEIDTRLPVQANPTKVSVNGSYKYIYTYQIL